MTGFTQNSNFGTRIPFLVESISFCVTFAPMAVQYPISLIYVSLRLSPFSCPISPAPSTHYLLAPPKDDRLPSGSLTNKYEEGGSGCEVSERVLYSSKFIDCGRKQTQKFRIYIV